MNLIHSQNLNKDFSEAKGSFVKFIISAKLFYYFFQRPLTHLIIKEKLKLDRDPIFNKIDRFLLDEGGMFKNYVYKICNRFHPLRNSTILVPGVGYGKNLFQLAAFRPKLIVAFDLYKYKNEWDFVSQKIFKEFGVKVLIFKGDFESIPKIYESQFDFIISDAVLEHVRDLSKFMEFSRKFLKRNGIFYAAFGPIWYGPNGDHLNWGKDKLFNHLLLNEKEYQKKFNEVFNNSCINDSCEGYFLVKEKLFSYLKAKEYLEICLKAGFQKLSLFAKISTLAFSFLNRHPEINDSLNEKGFPQFDRFCRGFYLWMRLQ